MKSTLAVLACASLSLAAGAQPPVVQGETVEVTAVIEAIDHDARLVTLVDAEGDVETVYCGPEVKRFDELKVGDRVTFRYYESLVYMVRQPGDPTGLPSTTPEAVVSRTKGTRPGATLSRQVTATVTVKAIDVSAPSITVLTEDGRRATFKVDDKKNLQGVKLGDKVEVAYTRAVLISVK
jgi:Cu/Ag efflux protein CusF